MGFWDFFKKATDKAAEINDSAQQINNAVAGVSTAYNSAKSLLVDRDGTGFASGNYPNTYEDIGYNALTEIIGESIGGSDEIEMMKCATEITKDGINLYRQSIEIQRDIEKIRACSLVEIKKITERYALGHQLIERAYDERTDALNKHYELLDKAMATDNKEVLIMALQNISGIVTSKPFDSFNNLLQNWDKYDDKNPLIIDF